MAERLTISDIRQHQRMGGSFHPRSYSASLEDTALAALAEVESLQAQLAHQQTLFVLAERVVTNAESDLAAVRTDLSVARRALEKIAAPAQDGVFAHGLRAVAREALSGLTATPPVAQLPTTDT